MLGIPLERGDRQVNEQSLFEIDVAITIEVLALCEEVAISEIQYLVCSAATGDG